VDGASGKVPGNGWVICTIVNETEGVAIFAAAGAHFRWLPRLISSENGTKNLSDALKLAIENSRAYQFRKEGLYLSALTLT